MVNALRILAIWASILAAVGAAEPSLVEPLPILAQASSWSASAPAEAALAVGGRGAWLEVPFRAARGMTGRLLLREPVAIPAWAGDLTFLVTNNGAVSGLRLRAVVHDAAGDEFRMQAISRFSFEGGVFFPEHAERRARVERFHVPGLARPVPVTQAGGTVLPPRPNLRPRPPLRLVGLEFDGERQQPADSVTWLYFSGFAITRLDPATTAGHYLYGDQERFAELEPEPALTAGEFGRWFGRRFDLRWELLADYAGQPVRAGAIDLRMPAMSWDEGAGRDYPLRLAERIPLPLPGEGTWWVRCSVRWFRGEGDIPDEILVRERRLDVLRGPATAAAPAPWPAGDDPPGRWLRIAPDRARLVWEADEPFACGVRFIRRSGTGASHAALVEVRTAGDGQVVRRVETPLAWDAAGRSAVAVDLAGLPPGAYRLHATLRAGARTIDEDERLIGRRGEVPALAAAQPGTAAAALRDGPRALFHLRPIVDEALKKDPQADWDAYLRPFLDRAGELSHDLELAVPWEEVEPLPGVYDWRGVDRFLAAAHERGFQTLLCPEFRSGCVPEWLPGRFVRDPAGRIGGSNAYLFHGARPDYVHDPAVRDGVRAFVAAMARRYRGHPGLQGWFLCFENPCDAPWAGWYEGYSPAGTAAFRDHARRTWRDLAGLEARWKLPLPSWEALQPPSRLAEATDRRWLDWLEFRADAIDGFLKGLVRAVRETDERHLVVVYGDGVRDPVWLRDQGCMLANGGSQDAMQIPGYAAKGMLGIPERTEDITPGDWTACFPSQPESSLFAMMAGGGANAHCKAFVRTRFAFADLADPQRSLGRYRRLQPIWQALRSTGVPEIGTILFHPSEAQVLPQRTTYGAWETDTWSFLNAMQAQVPVALGLGDLWRRARLLIMPAGRATALTDASLAAVQDHVERGGTVLMWADSGRRSVDRPGEDWVLLRRFGFTPPGGPCRSGQRLRALTVAGDIFPTADAGFTVRDSWEVGLSPDCTMAACADGRPDRPLLSWRAVGRGRVAVVWAQTVIPAVDGQSGAGHPYLRDIARWAGVRLDCASDQPGLWMNLLADRDGRTWYGLVHAGQWQGVPAGSQRGQVRWPGLPDGSYEMAELLTGRDLGVHPGPALRDQGLAVELAPREVAVYRFRRR